MKTIQEIRASIEGAKKQLMKSQDSVSMGAALATLNRLVFELSLYERPSDETVTVCVTGTAPAGGDAAGLAELYRTRTAIKAWPGAETGEAVFFPVDYGDLIMVMNDLEERGYSYRIEGKEQGNP